MVKTRVQAFGIHLGISTVIFIGLLAMLYYSWFPDFLFATDGGWDGVKILIGVDLVLGPLLTLVVYKHGKPRLKFDLTVIALLQSVCLIAGMSLVHSQRPLAIVYVDEHFYSLSSDSFSNAGLSVPDFSKFPGSSPKWLAVDIPTDVFEQSAIRQSSMQKGIRLRLLAERYMPFAPNQDFLNSGFDQKELIDRDRDSQAIPEWLATHGGSVDDYIFYPFGARYKYAFLGFHRANGALVGLLDTAREPTVENP